jgi:putative endopeptidase
MRIRTRFIPAIVIPSLVGSLVHAQGSDADVRAAKLGLIQNAATKKAPTGSPAQRVGDLYAGFMDTVRVNSLGLEPLREDLMKINNASTKKDIAVLYGLGNFIYVPFRLDIIRNPNDSTRYVAAITQSGLDMHDPQPYLSMEPKAVEVREKFVVFLSKMLALVDSTNSLARAQKILELETAVAKVARPKDEAADAKKQTETWTLAQLIERAPGFDWAAYLESNQIDPSTPLFISQPDVIKGVAAVMEKTSLETLKDHLVFSIICTWGWYGALPQSIFALQFDFYGRTRRNDNNPPTRLQQAYNFVTQRLASDVDALYQVHLGKSSADPTAPTPGPEIRRDDVYGNGKRIHFWNWERRRTRLAAH